MTTKFFAILTNQGAARLANAAALGTKLNITQMAVGDANGALPTPDPAQTKLINQTRISPINSLGVDTSDASQIIAEQIIPENEGGFWIREIGLFDEDGVLIAIANCPETYKPLLAEGSGRTQTIRVILIVSSTAAVTLKIDPSVVLATRKYVDDKVIEVKAYTDDQLKKHVAAANPHKQYPLIENALKEIADAGLADEVAENMGFKSAAKRDVGNGANQIPDMSLFASLKGENGYFSLPDGTIVQYGRATNVRNNEVGVVTLPFAFPARFSQVLITHDDASTPASLAFGAATPKTVSTFQVVVQKLNLNVTTGAVDLRTGVSPCYVRYIAIGS